MCKPRSQGAKACTPWVVCPVAIENNMISGLLGPQKRIMHGVLDVERKAVCACILLDGRDHGFDEVLVKSVLENLFHLCTADSQGFFRSFWHDSLKLLDVIDDPLGNIVSSDTVGPEGALLYLARNVLHDGMDDEVVRIDYAWRPVQVSARA